MLFAWIDDIQKSRGLAGDVFEIGVHHGRSAVLLGAMVQGERGALGVCDVFGEQRSNVSDSGHGDRQIFSRNMKTFGGDAVELRVFAKSSHELSAQEIGTTYRFFHIDGGHNPDEALHDLHLAASSMIAQGAIVVDDPLTPVWPGVAEAIFRFLDSNQRYCAIVAGFNKMILTTREFADMYCEEFDKADQRLRYRIHYPWSMKQLTFMNYPLRIFFVPTFRSPTSLKTRIIRYCQRYR